MTAAPQRFTDAEAAARHLVEKLGGRVVLGLPLGLGKAVRVTNAVYALAVSDASIELEIFTALTLAPPRAPEGLARRFLEPLAERLYGEIPSLDYDRDRRQGKLPANVSVSEFYFAPGSMLGLPAAQQDYVSCNYTSVVDALLMRGVNAVAQLVAADASGRYSLGSNPDVTLDLVDALGTRRSECIVVAEVSRAMPFMPNDAAVDAGFFDAVLDAERGEYPLFPVINRPVSLAAHAAAIHVASLLPDAGTIQIGIGSMGNAVAHGLRLRHAHNAAFRELLDDLCEPADPAIPQGPDRHRDAFDVGLYGASEVFSDSIAGLCQAGILKRRCFDNLAIQRRVDASGSDAVSIDLLQSLREQDEIGAELSQRDVERLKHFGILAPEVEFEPGRLRVPGGPRIGTDLSRPGNLDLIEAHCLGERLQNGRYLEAAFLLGSGSFYSWLGSLAEDQLSGIGMTRVSRVNQLYGDEPLRRMQRRGARFVNEAMMVTLTGAVVSDGLDDARIVSGIGGQYNFVAMAHALPDARSVIVLPATRSSGGELSSNVVWEYAHCSIPRHLRDIVVTEYGVADLRGRSDRDVIAALLAIADSRFQDELLETARRAGKIEADYEIPPCCRNNTPARVQESLTRNGRAALFPWYPCGTDMDDTEAELAVALDLLKARGQGVRDMLHAVFAKSPDGAESAAALARLGLDAPRTLKARLSRRLVAAALGEIRQAGRPLGAKDAG